MLNFIFCHTSEEFLRSLPDMSDYPENTITLQDFSQALVDIRPAIYRMDWFYCDISRLIAKERIHVMRAYIDTLESQLWNIEGDYYR